WMWLILGGSALLLSGRHAASVSTWTVLGSLIVVAALRMIPAQGTFGVVAGLVWIAGAGALLITWLRGVDPHARRAIARGARAFLSFARFAAAEVGTEDGRRVLLLADPRYDKAQPDQPRTWPVREPLDP